MPDTINVALVGLGRIGQQFADRFADHVATGDKSIMIIAVAEKDTTSEAAKRFSDAGVPVYDDATKIIDLGDSVDIIFDLTGNSDLRTILRKRLHDSDNRHTVIAPEIMVRLLWSFIGDVALSGPVRDGYA